MNHKPVAFGDFSPDFVANLAERLRGHRVLEIFAGNGFLASQLAALGVDIRATTLFAGHDGHEWGLHHAVEEIDAVGAVDRYGSEADILLMSWPTTTEAAALAVLTWGPLKPIIFIGEVPRPEWGRSGLSGCATDTFHHITDVVAEIPGYGGRGILDRAVELRLDPVMAARWHDLSHGGLATTDSNDPVSRPPGR